MKMCQKCGDSFPLKTWIQGKKRHLGNRKYCLKCSPFGEHNTKKLHTNSDAQTCGLCGNKIKDHRRRRCGSCLTRIRRYRTKMAAVKYLGGKCQRCGWSGHPATFAFHHVRGKKEFQIGHAANRRWELVKKELMKCKLLCLNCHGLQHHSQDAALIAAASQYQGRNLDFQGLLA